MGNANVTIVRVATWKHDAKAAYNIIHDDTCDSTTTGIFEHRKELIDRHLRAGFGIIVSECDDADYAILKEMMAAGHEMINHSYTHPHLAAGGADIQHEVVDSTNELTKQLGVPIKFFIFPYDEHNNSLFDQLKKLDYLGSRGGSYGGLNDPDVDTENPYADFQINFDVYETTGIGSLNSYVDKAIAGGKWANRELHGIADGSWGKITVDAYTTHLDYLVKQIEARQLWMDTPTTVLRYRRSRKYCGTPVAAEGVVRFPAPSADCQAFATPLSVVVTSSETGISAQQGGAEIPVEALSGGQFIIDIDPAKGDAAIFRK
jgi:Polysaccharide deacetylase